MRILLAFFCFCAALPAQETRSAIYGRVVDPSSSPVMGASVTVTNVETGVSAVLSTNETGYFEANLLLPGEYRLSAEAAGFKKSLRSGITLPAGTRLEIGFTLELGAVTESVSVTAEAPLLDTSAASSGWVLDNRNVMAMPILNNNATLLAKITPGVFTPGINQYGQLHAVVTSSQYSVAGNVGGNEWSVDGAPNNGRDRNVGYVPYADTVQEMKVETSNFDASAGHTTGVSVAIMTKAGTNQFHGTATWQHWQTRWQGAPFFTRQIYYRNIAQARARGDMALADKLRSEPMLPSGHSNNYAGTLGGPILKEKLFFFFGFNGYKEKFSESGLAVNYTVPTMANRQGDFSQLLQVDPVRYQIYDPLSVRPDPARPTHYIRDPIPGNVLPRARIVNPAYNKYVSFLPVPNNDPLSPKLEPKNNYVALAMPSIFNYSAYTNRIDYNLSSKHRFYGRWSWNSNLADRLDWTYESARGLHTSGAVRQNLAVSADWVYTLSSNTVLDVAAAGNDYGQGDSQPGARKYKPSDVGLPAYMDAKAGDKHVLPTMSAGGYQAIGVPYAVLEHYRATTARADLTHIRGKHTARFGLDVRDHFRTGGGDGSTSGAFSFSNAYTRRNDDTFTPAGDLGLSWAAFMMGIPSGMSVDTNDSYIMSNPYYGWFAQDQWRVTPKLSVTLGLRMEYEMGRRERFNRIIGWFDPNPKLPISDGAETAYRRSPVPELGGAGITVRGGSVYPGVGGASERSNSSELLWLPRAAFAWQWNSRTVLRGGYGMFYDTNNVMIYEPDQYGFSRSTSTLITNDFGMTWLAGNPGAGVSPLLDPFPVRADGTRFDAPVREAFGLMARAGRGFSYTDYDAKRARQQRWRLGVQRQIGNDLLVDAAYTGSYSSRLSVSRKLDPLPEQYWASGLARNDAVASNLNANVANPFQLKNLGTLDPALAQNLGTMGFFTSATIRKNQLLRAFPHMNGVTAAGLPMGEMRTHGLELYTQKRFSRGFSLTAAYTRMFGEEKNWFPNEFDTVPLWRESNNTRPHRFTGTAVVELPFGKGRRWAKSGLPMWLAGGWQTALTYEWQPGPLLAFGNVFYYGELADIAKGTRTLDRWFNTDGFERNASKGPAAFHRRVFPSQVSNVRRDMTNQWNANLQREFRFKERAQLQLRCDAVNLFNRSQFDTPDMSPTSTNFGRITRQTNSTNRFVQVQARLRW
ncbi:MAG: carboxypeptidase regulatory-like domain-containing protein [Bryobacteraceae bacterium]